MEPLAKSFPHDMATLDCRTFFCDILAVSNQDAVWVDSRDWSLAGQLKQSNYYWVRKRERPIRLCPPISI
jgi:hypothetical protein